MDASGRGGPNKYSAQTTFGPVRRGSLGRKEKTDGEERRRESEEIFKRSPEGEDHISSIPDICHGRHGRCPCKLFLAGVKFSRCNAKD